MRLEAIIVGTAEKGERPPTPRTQSQTAERRCRGEPLCVLHLRSFCKTQRGSPRHSVHLRWTGFLSRAPFSAVPIVLLATLLLPVAAQAQAVPVPTAIIQQLPECNFVTGIFTASCIPAFLAHLIRFIFGLTGAAMLVMVVIAGYQIALAKVMGKDRSEGLTRLRIAIVGFILCAIAWYIIDFIVSALAGI